MATCSVRWANAHHHGLGSGQPPIKPPSVGKDPSPKLRPGQTNQDPLPPYEALDAIIRDGVDRGEDVAAIARAAGIERATVARQARRPRSRC